MPAFAQACDVCGIFLGVQPNDRRSTMGLFYRSRIMQGVTRVPLSSNLLLKHGDHVPANVPSAEVPITEVVNVMELRADLRLACTHMTRTGADICRTLYDLGGGAALFESSDLQRRFRDAHAITQHIVTAPSTLELTGRILFGLPTDAGMV